MQRFDCGPIWRCFGRCQMYACCKETIERLDDLSCDVLKVDEKVDLILELLNSPEFGLEAISAKVNNIEEILENPSLCYYLGCCTDCPPVDYSSDFALTNAQIEEIKEKIDELSERYN